MGTIPSIKTSERVKIVVKYDPAQFAAASQSPNKDKATKADDWKGVTFATFTNQLESVSSASTAGRMAAGFIPVVDSIRLQNWD